MAYTIHLRVDASLVGIARVIRLLRRHAVDAAEVAIVQFSGQEVASVRGTLEFGGSTRRLATALSRAPNVLHAVIVSESHVIAEFSRHKQ